MSALEPQSFLEPHDVQLTIALNYLQELRRVIIANSMVKNKIDQEFLLRVENMSGSKEKILSLLMVPLHSFVWIMGDCFCK